MAEHRPGPQWHSVCVRGLEVQLELHALQRRVRTSLSDRYRHCGNESCVCTPELSHFPGRARKDSHPRPTISVWSSMKSSNINGVVDYLFPKGKLPSLVLGQESCTTIWCRDSSGRLSTYMVPGTQKELFLKNLDTLFCGYRGIFNSGNTVIVDNTPLKHIMNNSENVLLPNPWSHRGGDD